MKRGLLNMMLTVLAAASLAGCVYDNLVQIGEPTELAFDESDIIDVPLYVAVNAFTTSSSVSTRDEEPSDATETMTEFEKKIDNIWVFQFNADGNLLIKPRRYTAEKNEADGVWTVVLKPNVKSVIHVVANVTNGESWAEEYQSFATVDDLLAQTLPSPFPVIFGTEEGFLPMEGAAEGVTVESGGTVEVPVASMYAKLKAKVVFDSELSSLYEPAISAVSLSNIPWYCRVGTLYNEKNMSEPAEYPVGSYWISRAIGEGNDPDDDGYDYVFYIPENIQGENENDSVDLKTDEMPDNATLLTVQIGYVDSDTGASASQSHTVCPGGNSYNNYNIRRNCVYRVALKIGLPSGEEYQPSANCIYAAPGSTVSFEPYYRTEEGGGYKFSDYLAPNSAEGTGQQIKGVKILWQTKDCIGDNTNGDLVYFEPLKNGTEQTLHSRIYVTVNQPGNAVIAAYDDDPDTEGANIIWSWHIWVPGTDVPDPTNESNGKLYYTYEWNENEIYGLYSGRPRIPGYTIMDLNLGAMKSYPASASASDYVECYGTMYQWGRKDPFPAFKGDGISNTIGSGYGDYNATYAEPVYENDNETQIKMTAMDDVSGSSTTIYNSVTITIEGDLDDYLFHSVSGRTIEDNNYGVAYSIAHPTIFMCGTNNCTLNSNTIGNHHNSSDWLPQGYSDDRLWGATEVTDETKRYLFGTDNLSEYRHIYDNYGEKSIFDPCPYGWRTPPPDLWLGFSDTGTNPDESSGTLADHVNYSTVVGAGMNMYLQEWHNGVTSYFPTQGLRTPAGSVTHARQCGSYNPASPDTGANNKVNMLHIHNGLGSFHIFETVYLCYYAKSTAGPVRCVRTER